MINIYINIMYNIIFNYFITAGTECLCTMTEGTNILKLQLNYYYNT